MAATGIDPSSFGTFPNNVIAGNNFVTLGMLAWKHLTPKSIFIILLHTHTRFPLLFNHKKKEIREISFLLNHSLTTENSASEVPEDRSHTAGDSEKFSEIEKAI